MSIRCIVRCRDCVNHESGACPMIFLENDEETIINQSSPDGNGYCSSFCSWDEILDFALDWERIEVVECHECMHQHTDRCPKRCRHFSGLVEDNAYDEGFCYKGQRKEVK